MVRFITLNKRWMNLMSRGLLLINLGTPNSPALSDVKSYLREFLTDGRVISLPAIIRYPLVYGIIIPFRAKFSAHAYQSIWSDKGSPLLYLTQHLIEKLKLKLADDCQLAYGMRYGQPSIESALEQLKTCDTITLLPLFPQYSSAATGSAISKALEVIQSWEVIPSLTIHREFYQHPAYIKAQAKCIGEYIDTAEHVLFSYHGLPERQIISSGCKTVCQHACPPITERNKACYKAQCHQTSHLLADALKLRPNQFSTAFQSRLGKTPWIQPYTDFILEELAKKGIKKLAIACPSFVTDCLETLEEIGMRTREQWLALGGEELILVPSMNDSQPWIEALLEIAGPAHSSID
jgi:protoporphyrin/coproporphyrin ferrochelatase